MMQTFLLLYQTILKKVKFLHDTVFLLSSSQREYIMLQVFILIVTNHRKNDYYIIYHLPTNGLNRLNRPDLIFACQID